MRSFRIHIEISEGMSPGISSGILSQILAWFLYSGLSRTFFRNSWKKIVQRFSNEFLRLVSYVFCLRKFSRISSKDTFRYFCSNYFRKLFRNSWKHIFYKFLHEFQRVKSDVRPTVFPGIPPGFFLFSRDFYSNLIRDVFVHSSRSSFRGSFRNPFGSSARSPSKISPDVISSLSGDSFSISLIFSGIIAKISQATLSCGKNKDKQNHCERVCIANIDWWLPVVYERIT